MRRVNAALAHRGPDGEGEFAASNVFLAMRRLSIIDLAGGWQPLYSEDRSLALVVNGEIYNFVELRESLKKKGHRFSTGSDCETIVHLYEDHGIDFVKHLRGMFALALWDGPRKRLVLARDRMGEKPLYLFESDGQLLFASEMKALLASGRIPFKLDPGAICDYFHYEYVPEPRTAIAGVRKLPAGHLMVVNVEPWSLCQSCYWRMEDAPPLEGNPAELIREQLEDIGRIVIRSDVPVGIALSGGLDSSTVAVLASRSNPGKIHALTVGFEGAGWRDERKGARDMANHLGMPFHDVEISLGDVIAGFPQGCVDRDDPIADIAGHGYYALARLARQHNIPVLLQGQGSDELFWGYAWLRKAMGINMRRFGVPGPLPADYESWRGLFPRNLHMTGLRDYAFRVFGKLLGWSRPRPGQPGQIAFYDQSRGYQMGSYAVERIFTPAYREQLRHHNPAALFTFTEPPSDLGVLLTKLVCSTYLMEDGIAQGDRLSMVSSIELRLPLVDHRLVETVIGLRKKQPDQHLGAKAWFRDVIKEYLPEWVLKRPKIGFSPPTSLWMNILREKYGPALADGFLVGAGILDRKAAISMAKKHSQLTVWPVTMFKALVLEHWARGMKSISG